MRSGGPKGGVGGKNCNQCEGEDAVVTVTGMCERKKLIVIKTNLYFVARVSIERTQMNT